MSDGPNTYHVAEERIQVRHEADAKTDGRLVLYWMQHGQRAHDNPALEYAVRYANDLDLPAVVAFVFPKGDERATLRRYKFQLEGLEEVADRLAERDIKFLLFHGDPVQKIAAFAADNHAAAVVCDRGYLRRERDWREDLAGELDVPLVQIEGEVVVPIETTSDKREYAARTIRDKVMEHVDDFEGETSESKLENASKRMHLSGDLDFSSVSAVLDALAPDDSVGPAPDLTGGTSEARNHLSSFLRGDLDGYDDGRLDPNDDATSHLSAYLHFGQISPMEVVRKVRDSSAPKADRDAFLEELIVRRELSKNFVYYARDTYDSLKALPDWAAETLQEHKSDDRPDHYTRSELEEGKTDDEAWNAAMREMRNRGFLPNYMRMYWGKQIIRWTNTPDYAHETALYLNNKYFLDGYDANSYGNVLWLFGLHDRAWQERDVYGKVRTMTKGGMEGKFDVEAYVARVEEKY